MKERTKNKRVSRLLALALALAMFQPLGIRAEDTPTQIPEPLTDSEVAASTAEEPETDNEVTADFVAVEEVEDRRGEYERHFLCGDGSYVAIHYGYPVNYPNEEGEWQEIDNTLTAVTDAEGNQVVENKDGLFDVCFSTHGEGDELVRMEQDGYTLSWNVTAATDTDTILDSLEKEEIDAETAARVFGKAERKAEKEAEKAEKKAEKEAQKAAKEEEKAQKKAEKEAEKEAKKAEREEQKAALGLEDAKHGKVNAPGQIKKKDTSAMTETERLTSAHKASSTLVYEEAFGMENVDVAYEISPTSVKENIVLNSVSEITSYEVTMTAEGMTATLEEDSSITFADEAGNMQFVVASPVMYDAAGEESYDIAVTLTDNGDGTYTVVYTPSVSWLLSAARVYPVNVDPTVSTSRTTDYIVDTYVIENGAAGSAAYKSPFLYAGKQPDGRDIDAYLRVDKKAFCYSSGIANIPKYSYIEAAALNFFLAPTVDSSRTETAGKDLKITPLKQSWSQTAITYASGKTLSSGSTITAKRKTNSAGRKYYSLDVTSDVIEAFTAYWTTGSLTDTYGWRIESNNAMERLWSGNAGYDGAYGDSTDRPYIWIRYKPLQLDVDQYYQQAGFSCGAACSVMLLQYHKGDIETLYESKYSNSSGTTPLDIRFYRYTEKEILTGVVGYHNGYKKVGSVPLLWQYVSKLNTLLEKTDIQYKYLQKSKNDYTSQQEFLSFVSKSLIDGCPVMANVNVTAGTKEATEFEYTRDTGHYVLITGISESNGETVIVYNDPHYDFEDAAAGQNRDVSASTFYSCCKNITVKK